MRIRAHLWALANGFPDGPRLENNRIGMLVTESSGEKAWGSYSWNGCDLKRYLCPKSMLTEVHPWQKRPSIAKQVTGRVPNIFFPKHSRTCFRGQNINRKWPW